MNDCIKYITYMNMHLDDELDEALQAELENHLEHCPNCRKRFAEYCMISAQMQGGVNVPKNLHSSVMAYVHSNTVAAKPKKRFNVSAIGIVAAMLLLVFTGTFTRFNSMFLFQNKEASPENGVNATLISDMPSDTAPIAASEGAGNKLRAAPFAMEPSAPEADTATTDEVESKIDIDEQLAYYYIFKGSTSLPEFVSDYAFTKDKEDNIYYIFVDNKPGEYEKITVLLNNEGFMKVGTAPNAPQANKGAEQGLIILILQ